MKKKLTLLFALLCVSMMGWGYDLAPNTKFWGDHNFQWQEISGTTPPANVVNVQSKEGFDCLYITFVDAIFNRDYIVGGTVFTDAGAQAWLKLESFTNQYTDVLFYQTGSTTDVRWGLRIYNPAGTPAASCDGNHLPVVSAVSAATNISSTSAQVTITASDEDGDDLTYVVKNGGVQIASSSSSTITITGLSYGTTYDALKVYAVDVGILRRLSYLPVTAFAENNRLFTEFKGALTENYVHQSLKRGFEVAPRYWTDASHEVDFIVQRESDIIPVDAKAGESVTSTSLKRYAKNYGEQTSLMVRLSMRNLSYDGKILNIPLFMADELNRLIRIAMLQHSV